jgi:glycosyltransferase involved in cell wall biosynthesis
MREPPREEFEIVRDFRSIENPRCSIIVSVYRAADKVHTFLRGLSRLTERTLKSVDVVFIDSASPDDTQETLLDEIHKVNVRYGLSAVYARTRQRETIQMAWNRGISLARGVYLAFLGVDEMNRPDAFDLMIDYLDRYEAVDWVQGNAVVTEVNSSGAYVKDIMPYKRQLSSRYMHLLDCCYIGYVGALYRSSIHKRFGFYDASFRAAVRPEIPNSKTEFSRVLMSAR